MKLRNFAIMVIAASVLASCTTRRGGPADVEYDSYKSPYHIVRRGETIASIANTYHIDKRELVRLNGMKPPYRISVGQKLLVGARQPSGHDEFYSPATDAQQQGEVKVATLAPLPGTEEEGIANQQPFAGPEYGQEMGRGEEIASAPEDETEIAAADSETPIKAYRPLGETPKSAAFYTWPVRGKIVKGFSAGKGGHTGINISAAKGTPVKAANNGVVSRTEQIPGYGKVVLVRHQDGIITVYAHLDQITVKRGEVVTAGQKIGTVGKTGNVKEPQLHFKINKGKTPVDPTKYLD
ncbi:MAG: M23 family metallopeptidase [Candidatus Paracaedibacteraceae bacterium]|nr:M23 family metallopeptidase [Candidatus Paracaedibacteraceae bacterium]